jgi:hypothetical protein
LFGDEWHYPVGDRAVEEDHDFKYLRRIVEAVQGALRVGIVQSEALLSWIDCSCFVGSEPKAKK